jgi:hypothetical protein
MSPSPRSGLRVAALIVGGVGVVLGLAGYVVWRYVPGIVAAEHARLAALPTPSAISLTDLPAGREVIVEGRIAPEQPVRFRDFVAYVKEEERRDTRDDDRREWRAVEHVTPPLSLVADGGRIEIVNASYALHFAHTRWNDTSRVIDTAYYGLVAREGVFARGRVAAGGIEAITVGSGTRDAYLARVAGNAAVGGWLGVIFGGVAGILLIVATALLVTAARKGRPAAPWPAPPAAR